MSERPTLAASYQAAQTIMKQHSKSFYQAFQAIPADRFRGVAAVYAFCRYVDDLVDEATQPPEIVRAQLDRLAHVIGRLGEVPVPAELALLSWWPAFEETVQTFGVSHQALLDQIQGQASDITFAPYETLADLIGYCRLVAGSVGAMLWPMLASEEALAVADQAPYIDRCYQLGVALQLTNILRDIGEDARQRGRVYLPQDLLARHGWTPEAIVTLAQSVRSQREVPVHFGPMWEELAQVSQDYYQTLDGHLVDFHPDCRLGLLAAMSIYQAIEDEVRRDGYNCLSRRHYTSPITRLRLVQAAKRRLQTLTKEAP